MVFYALLTVSHRTYVPFDTRAYVQKVCTSTNTGSRRDPEPGRPSAVRRAKRFRTCGGLDAVPFVNIFTGSCIDPTTAAQIGQIQAQQAEQEKANAALKQTMDNQFVQLRELQQNAVANNQIMAQKFNDYEHVVAQTNQEYLAKLQDQINQALAEWQQESNDFVLFVNFRMKQILYDWKARLEYMRSSLQGAIDWTYHITDSNVRNINSHYQVVVELLQSIQGQYQQNELTINSMNQQMTTLIQILLGFGHIAERYYNAEKQAIADGYYPYLGRPGFSGYGVNQTIVIGSCVITADSDKQDHYIFYACSACPNCATEALRPYECRPYFRPRDCPNWCVNCNSVSHEGSITIEGAVLEYFHPTPNATNTLNGTVSYALPSAQVGQPDVRKTQNFTGTDQMMQIIYNQINSYVSTMSLFFGTDPTYWRTTLPEGLQVTDEPSAYEGGVQTTQCKQFAFAGIRNKTLDKVPVYVLSLIATNFSNAFLKKGDMAYNFLSAYANDPYLHLLPADQKEFIHSVYPSLDLIVSPPFDLVSLKGNGMSRLGTVTYLFNNTGDFSYANNYIYDYNPMGLGISSSLYVNGYSSSDPWCGREVQADDKNKPAWYGGQSVPLTNAGNSFCALTRYYDIVDKDDQQGNRVIVFRSKYATLRYVYQVDVQLDVNMAAYSCPNLTIADDWPASLLCNPSTCLLNLHNFASKPILFRVRMESQCGIYDQVHNGEPLSDINLSLMSCPGSSYNISIIGPDNAPCFSPYLSTFKSYSYDSVKEQITSQISIFNFDVQRKVVNEYQKSINQTDQTITDLHNELQRLQITSTNYTVVDVVQAFNFTINTAILDSYLRNMTAYKALNFSTQLKAKFTNYSQFFAGVNQQMEDLSYKMNLTQVAFDQAWQKIIDDYNRGTDGMSPTNISVALIVLPIVGCLLILAFGLPMYMKSKQAAGASSSSVVESDSEKTRPPAYTSSAAANSAWGAQTTNDSVIFDQFATRPSFPGSTQRRVHGSNPAQQLSESAPRPSSNVVGVTLKSKKM